MQDTTLRQGCEEPQFVLVQRGIWPVFISAAQHCIEEADQEILTRV